MKINKEYTPGPWLVEYDNGKECMVHTSNDSDFIEIKTFEFKDQHHANARLISAAPELVEAIIEQCKSDVIHEYMMDNNFFNENPATAPDRASKMAESEWPQYLTDIARAALTKAGVLKTEK